jgi:hypothetical protein
MEVKSWFQSLLSKWVNLSRYTVEASMLQIYNENIDCLLADDREKAAGLQGEAVQFESSDP